ncbi:Phloem protein 2-like [Sesbania bispinosa]|nr:Phloem protein 2-like [Sesbania bispinosa]
MVKVMVVEAEDGRHGKAAFEHLPEGCIANVLSFTTPRDACILSLVSSTFRSAAQSDVVWDRFLPSDYRSILSESSSLAGSSRCASKKDLYLYLCQTPFLSFILDKLYGKRCYMLSPRTLSIVWGDTPRFSEVAELVSVCWLEIKGRMKTCMLSPETLYGAYLVFQQGVGGAFGFESQPVEVSVGIPGEGEAQRRIVYLDEPRPRRPPYHRIFPRGFEISNRNRVLRSRYRFMRGCEDSSGTATAAGPSGVGNEYPKERGDGWWEIELGEFYNKGEDDKEREVEMGVCEVTSGDWKGGIVLQGIELRPKYDK